ncbi:MAG: mechanosensitive ion channel family protein [Actinomycetota bacterium]|nr:mechanosensitive ion channel family protein [Actinomycetota bacterium]
MLLSLISTIAQVASTTGTTTTAAGSGATAACGPPSSASSLCLSVYRTTGNSVVAQMSETLVVKPAKIALIFAIAWLARRILVRLIGRLINGHARRVETVAALFRSVTSVTVWTIATLMALAELGLNLGPLIAGAGIVGVAVGFGAQNLVRDFLSGIFMLVEDQYGVGDVIDAGPAVGTVEGVSLRSTRLRDVNGTVWHVPNGQIERIGNRSQHWSRAVLDVDVSYQTDISHATEVIKATADGMCEDPAFAGSILSAPEVWGVEDLGADSVTIRVALKTTPHDQLKVTRELRARIKGAFDVAGIEIPFAQRTVWHRTGDGATALVPAIAASTSDHRAP